MQNRIAGYPSQLAPHLELKRVLGEGGSSVVFEAFHSRLKVPVAVKLLSVRGALAQQARARLLREAELYALLDDPRIPRVYDVDELPDGTPFVVMEFVPGNSLEALLLSGPLSPRRAVGIAQQVLAALAYVHSRGVLHRDVKPANVILCENEDKCHVRLVDFGIAKVSDDADQTLTQQGTIVGTPHYMAPERLLGYEAGERADLYSVGVMLYEMLSGVVPFGGPTLGEVIAAVLRDDPEPLRARAPQVGPELERVVQRAMQREPSARFASAAEMQSALTEIDSVLKGEASSPRIVSMIRQLPLPSLEMQAEDMRPSRRQGQQAPLLLLGAGAILLLWTLLWPSGVVDLRAQQLEPPPSTPAHVIDPAMPAQAEEPPSSAALAASPVEEAAPAVQAALPGAPATGVADRLTGEFANALGANGLGDVLGQVGGSPLAAPPVQDDPNAGTAGSQQAESEGATGSAEAVTAAGGTSSRPAAQLVAPQSLGRSPRARADAEVEAEEAPASDFKPVKSVPLQPLLDELDKLLKEPPPAPVQEPKPAPELRPRRQGKVELPANPY